MKEINENFYKKLFFLGSLWNLSIGITGIFFYEFCVTMFFGKEAIAYNLLSVLFFKLMMTAIVMFGIGYYLVSRELTLNRGIVWLGLVSKLILFTVFAYYFIVGQATLFAFLTLCGDFTWSIFFIRFLVQSAAGVKVNNIVG